MTVLSIETERFGPLEVPEETVISFLRPLLGFEQYTRFVLLDHEEDSPFKWLQSTEDPALAFVLTMPVFFGLDYQFTLPEDAAKELGLESANDVSVYTLVTIPDENPSKMTSNLLAPIVLANKHAQAMQVVLEDTETKQYSTKVRLIPDELIQAPETKSSESFTMISEVEA